MTEQIGVASGPDNALGSRWRLTQAPVPHPSGGLVMAIVDIQIDAIEPFADGQAFSEAGSYLRIKGIAKGEIDPAAPENSVIANLDKAPKNVHGMVEYSSDFFHPAAGKAASSERRPCL
jgi:hypothetical protein